LFWVFLNNNKK